MITISFEIFEKHAPAFKSIVEEMSNLVGKRLEQASAYPRQDALTYAAVALGALRAAVTRQVRRGDPALA